MIYTIIQKFASYIKQIHQTQQMAADSLGISRSHFNKIINGKDNPSTSVLLKMEQILEQHNVL